MPLDNLPRIQGDVSSNIDLYMSDSRKQANCVVRSPIFCLRISAERGAKSFARLERDCCGAGWWMQEEVIVLIGGFVE